MLFTHKKKKKENSEFLGEACACRFLISKNKYRKLICTEDLYCAKIKKKKNRKRRKNCISMGQYYLSKNCYKDHAAV